jgi:hypothetical protein
MMEQEYDECQRCGRHLKSPKARKNGYGKVCFAKAMAEKAEADQQEEQKGNE